MKRILILLFASILINCSSSSETVSSSKLSISPAALTLIDVIAGKFPGVEVIGDNVANYLDYHKNMKSYLDAKLYLFKNLHKNTLESVSPKILIRGGSQSINYNAYAVYDVDGLLYTDYPGFIDPQQIKSITILRSLAATNKYGGIARGGAIVIRLKGTK